MTKIFTCRYLLSLQKINNSFNINNSSLYRNMQQHGCTLLPISRLLSKTNENNRINETSLCSNLGTNSLLKCNFTTSTKWYVNKNDIDAKKEQVPLTTQPKLGLVARFKDLTKKYWYLLLPVHVLTSAGWLAGFYYLSTSGVDMVALLQSMSISESIIDKMKDSTMGHVAITYMLYKIATPLRYTVTIGGTTISIKYLSQRGYIKPMPTKEELQKFVDDKKAQIKQSYDDTKAQMKQGYDDTKAQVKQGYEDTKAQVKHGFDDTKAHMKQVYDEQKSMMMKTLQIY